MKIMLLAVFSLIMLSLTGACAAVEIPACEDVYVDLGTFEVHNTDELRCDAGNFSNLTLVQFNISQANITDDDVGMLVLRAARIDEEDLAKTAPDNSSSIDMSGLILLPTVSNWSERSRIGDLLVSLKSMVEAVAENGLNLGKVGACFDGDRIVAFDVSRSLKDAKARGDRASFILSAFSFKNYSVAFSSRETGSGPYLLIMPYPRDEGAQLQEPSSNQTDREEETKDDLTSQNGSISPDTDDSVRLNTSESNVQEPSESSNETLYKSESDGLNVSTSDLGEGLVPESNQTAEKSAGFSTPFAQNAIQEIIKERSRPASSARKDEIQSMPDAAISDMNIGLDAPDADIW